MMIINLVKKRHPRNIRNDEFLDSLKPKSRTWFLGYHSTIINEMRVILSAIHSSLRVKYEKKIIIFQAVKRAEAGVSTAKAPQSDPNKRRYETLDRKFDHKPHANFLTCICEKR